MKILQSILILVAIAFSPATKANAPNYPNRPIQLAVGYAAGGAVDAIARKLGAMLGERLGWQVLVENRPGASGNIAAAYVARAKADGYTLLLAPSTLLANPLVMNTNGSFDLNRDLNSIFRVASGPLIMLGPLTGPSTVEEFVSLAKEHPADFNFGTGGFGSAPHLATEHFKQEAGIGSVPVILYKGTAAAMADVISGRLSATMEPMLSATSQILGGKVRALAITAEKRNPMFPQVPTFAEVGYPDMRFDTWYGVWGPSNLPREVMQELLNACKLILKSPEFNSWAEQQGYVAAPLSGEELTDFLAKEYIRYESIVRIGKISAQ